ncbi:hypothetical protein OV090_09715 [Nannocystis sp. RBIL2]|uniref:IS66 family transposase n=1 Tax=Nannocystis sp. RBIL2 TaxID=2996788 RepID=UPI00226E4CB0|nr:hypothetical protein [Nannocystis sp. RBIL2]
MLGATHGPGDCETKTLVEQLSAERDHYRKLYLETLEKCAMLERGILVGKKAERFEDETPQLALDVLDMLLGQGETDQADAPAPDMTEEADPVQGRPERRRRPAGRRPLPEHLPRVEIEVLPPEVLREGLDAYERIGQEVSEVLERRPASLAGTSSTNRR